MDVILGGHVSTRQFCSSISCLSRIGKDLYMDFDPIEGLNLRAINDAKSAYSCHHYKPSYFERCTGGGGGNNNADANNNNNNRSGRKRNHSETRRTSLSSSLASSQSSSSSRREGRRGDSLSESQTQSTTSRFTCRVPMKALTPVVRQRKGILSLRIRSSVDDGGGGGNGKNNDNDNNGDDDNEEEENASTTTPSLSSSCLFLSFEFHIRQQGAASSSSWAAAGAGGGGGVPSAFRVIHRIKVAEASGVTAVASRTDASEIVTSPKVLSRLLDPLLSGTGPSSSAGGGAGSSSGAAAATATASQQAAFVLGSERDVVSAASFHPGGAGNNNNNDGINNAGGRNTNVLLNAATASMLKTETCISVEEFDEFVFRVDRDLRRGDDDAGPANRGQPAAQPPPNDVNEQVILVFPMKEAKSFLQFCSSSSSSSSPSSSSALSFFHDNIGNNNNNGSFITNMNSIMSDGNAFPVTMYFHWGGKPIVFETGTNHFNAELVLATLDYKLLGPLYASAQQQQQRPDSGQRRSKQT